jgi:hypothetical protein
LGGEAGQARLRKECLWSGRVLSDRSRQLDGAKLLGDGGGDGEARERI